MVRFYFLFFILFSSTLTAQQNYCDFENVKLINFGWSTGALDSAAQNPFPDSINPSSTCAKYIRDDDQWDNMKIYPVQKLSDVTPYADNTFQTPTMKMKLYTSAPVGTKMRIQLGSKNGSYPSGVHSEYIAVTKKQYAWEVVTFYYNATPQGSTTGPAEIDKIVFFFNYNSSARDTLYFDDFFGPELLIADIPEEIAGLPGIRLFQNSPNPADANTNIKLVVSSPGPVSVKLYDMIGNHVSTIVNQDLKTGAYSFPLETAKLSEGIYFYTLEKDGISRSMKMVVSR